MSLERFLRTTAWYAEMPTATEGDRERLRNTTFGRLNGLEVIQLRKDIAKLQGMAGWANIHFMAEVKGHGPGGPMRIKRTTLLSGKVEEALEAITVDEFVSALRVHQGQFFKLTVEQHADRTVVQLADLVRYELFPE